MLKNKLEKQAEAKGNLFKKLLKHKAIIKITGIGLLLAVHFEEKNFAQKVIQKCIEKGVITDWFLYAENCMRIAPPLIISDDEIRFACDVILESIDEVLM